ncbi:hypothetical protein [Nocardia sp. NPDC050175]
MRSRIIGRRKRRKATRVLAAGKPPQHPVVITARLVGTPKTVDIKRG